MAAWTPPPIGVPPRPSKASRTPSVGGFQRTALFILGGLFVAALVAAYFAALAVWPQLAYGALSSERPGTPRGIVHRGAERVGTRQARQLHSADGRADSQARLMQPAADAQLRDGGSADQGLGMGARTLAPLFSRAAYCYRYAAVPSLAWHGEDQLATIHTSASAQYCPPGSTVQIRACVQLSTPTGWANLGCVTSPRVTIPPYCRGGCGVAVSVDVSCRSGVVRTRVTGGEGQQPTVWVSGSATVKCR